MVWLCSSGRGEENGVVFEAVAHLWELWCCFVLQLDEYSRDRSGDFFLHARRWEERFGIEYHVMGSVVVLQNRENLGNRQGV